MLDPLAHWTGKPARLTAESNTTHDLAVERVFLCRKRTPEPALTADRWFLSV